MQQNALPGVRTRRFRHLQRPQVLLRASCNCRALRQMLWTPLGRPTPSVHQLPACLAPLASLSAAEEDCRLLYDRNCNHQDVAVPPTATTLICDPDRALGSSP